MLFLYATRVCSYRLLLVSILLRTFVVFCVRSAILEDSPYDFGSSHGRNLRLVRQHGVDLARSHAIEELSQLHNDLHELTPDQAARRRQRNHRLLTRLASGRGCSHYAICD